MKTFSFIVLFLLNAFVHAQKNSIIGVVIDADSKAPIGNCNVFISNTTAGTVTDTAGQFRLYNIEEGSFELVLSSVGYETFIYNFSSEQLPLNVKVSLNKRVIEMENVTITPFEIEGWKKWGSLFMNHFLGQSENGYRCEIENADIIKFRMYKKEGLLEASADGILIIRNYPLGYLIKYQLEKFVFDFKNQRVSYSGYPLFLEMEPGQPLSPAYRWKRLKAYKGSIMHFIRSLSTNKLTEEGFEVRRMELVPGNDTIMNDGKRMHKFFMYDSAGRQKIPPFIVKKAGKERTDTFLLTKDSIVFKGIDSVSIVLSFNNYLSVFYLHEKEPESYRRSARSVKSRDFQYSKFTILNKEKKILIESNGYYYPALDFFVEGYLAWEKIGDQLPLDYIPNESGK